MGPLQYNIAGMLYVVKQCCLGLEIMEPAYRNNGWYVAVQFTVVLFGSRDYGTCVQDAVQCTVVCLGLEIMEPE